MGVSVTQLIVGGVIFATALLLAFFAFSNKLKRRDYCVVTDKIKNDITVAHISDLHESSFGQGQSELISAVRKSAPDIIIVSGDMVNDEHCKVGDTSVMGEGNPARILLEKLPEIAPTFMTYGNHEGNIPEVDVLTKEIRALGIKLLHREAAESDDEFTETLIAGERVLICGADDPYFDRVDSHFGKKKLAERIDEDIKKSGYGREVWRARLWREYAFIKDEPRLTLLISHRPEEYELYEKLSFDAAFSGHAHGGQWRLPPFINGIYAPNQGLFPRHAGGIYRYERFTHIVSRGLSKKRMVRIFNRPELCVVKFVSDAENKGCNIK